MKDEMVSSTPSRLYRQLPLKVSPNFSFVILPSRVQIELVKGDQELKTAQDLYQLLANLYILQSNKCQSLPFVEEKKNVVSIAMT